LQSATTRITRKSPYKTWNIFRNAVKKSASIHYATQKAALDHFKPHVITITNIKLRQLPQHGTEAAEWPKHQATRNQAMKQLLSKLEAMTLVEDGEFERGLQIRSKATKSKACA
jgi:hypothetical protein